ncbi:MAG: copper resistance CopC family protein, partial [Acidimicrobiales bacterium]
MRCWLGTAALSLLMLVAVTGRAEAHARLVSTSPAGGSTVTQAPAEIVLQFSERIETSFGGVQIFDADGQRVESGEPRIAAKEVRTSPPPLPPGAVTVVFRIVSADSHPVESRFAFTYAPLPPPPGPDTPSDDQPGNANEPPPAAVPLRIRLQDAGQGSDVGLWVARFVNYLTMVATVGLLLVAGVL